MATAAGIMAALAPLLLAGCLGVFLLGIVFSRIVSVGSMMAALGAPLGAALLGSHGSLLFLSLALACGILWRHKENIRRLLKGQEKPLALKGNKNKPAGSSGLNG